MALKQWPLIRVEFFLAKRMTYLFYCLNHCVLECSLRKGMVMGVSMRKSLTLFFVKVIAFTLNLCRKSFSILWPKLTLGKKWNIICKCKIWLGKLIFGHYLAKEKKISALNAWIQTIWPKIIVFQVDHPPLYSRIRAKLLSDLNSKAFWLTV